MRSIQVDALKLKEVAPTILFRLQGGPSAIYDVNYARDGNVFSLTSVSYKETEIGIDVIPDKERRALNRFIRSCVWPDPETRQAQNGIKLHAPSIAEFSVGPNYSVIVIRLGIEEWVVVSLDGSAFKTDDPSGLDRVDLWPEAIETCRNLSAHVPL
jgi:hypothetical protein